MLHKDRIERLADELARSGLDALYIGPSTDAEYIAELDLFADERVKGLMVSAKREIFAMVPLLYQEEMRASLGDGVSYKIWADHEGFRGAFAEGCRELGLEGGRIAINDGVRAVDLINMQKAVRFEAADGTATLSPLRSRKDASERDLTRRASAISDRMLERLSSFIKPGMTEADVKRRVRELYKELGAPELSFEPIVAAGLGASMPHYSREDKVIERGDFIVVDTGCRWERYCSDTTRTFIIGEPDAEQRRVYDVVLEAQKAGEAAVVPGATGQDVDRAARRVIEDAGYGEYFLNRVGHGVGIAIHEEPYMIEGNDVPLAPGNVFSVEPGIYIAGKYGVRIENLILVGDDGRGEPLNRFTRDLIVL